MLLLLFPSLHACALSAEENSKKAQMIVGQAPVTLAEFLASPIDSLKKLAEEPLLNAWKESSAPYTGLLLFLLLAAALQMTVPDPSWQPLLGLIGSCGCFLLISSPLVALAQTMAERSVTWRDFLVSYVPVYASLMAAGGQPAGAAACNGFFLMLTTLLAEGIRCFLIPFASVSLSVSMAGVFSGSEALCMLYEKAGRLLRRAIRLAGVLFTALLGLQRAFTASADAAAMTGAALLTGAVPIVGQSLTAAVQAVSAGAHMLQAGLAFAALAILGAEFIPLYAQAILNCALLEASSMLSRVLALEPCEKLLHALSCFCAAMTAILALFFGMVAVSTFLMLAVGRG